MRIIPPSGPPVADVMLLGERAGINEAKWGIPFTGKSGLELDRYLLQGGVQRDDIRVWNVCHDYLPKDPDPTEEELARDWPQVVAEIKRTKPKVIGLVGRIAAGQFIPDLDMTVMHGMAFRWRHIDVMPLFHPAFALHQPSASVVVSCDFARFCQLVKNGPDGLTLPVDNCPETVYRLVTSLDTLPRFVVDQPIYIDTEGSVASPWSVQFTQQEGRGYVILAGNTAMLQRLAGVIKRLNLLVVMHHALHDIAVLRAMGIEGFRFRDTMIMAHNLCTVPQGLKPLTRRLTGAVQLDYLEVIGDAGKEKALDYLLRGLDWAGKHYPVESKTPSLRTIHGSGGRKSKRISPKSAAS